MIKLRVFIMEREERVNRLLCRIIKRMGFEPISVKNYADFKSLYPELNPDIILLNLEILGGDHNDLYRYLVEQDSPATIILLSNTDYDKLIKFKKIGKKMVLNMGGLLQKPTNIDSVTSKLTDLTHQDHEYYFK